MENKDIQLINLNILVFFIYIVTSMVTIFLEYNEKQKLSGNQPFVTNEEEKNIILINRTIFLLAVLTLLYIRFNNYNKIKEKTPNEELKDELIILLVSISYAILAIILLVIAYKDVKAYEDIIFD